MQIYLDKIDLLTTKDLRVGSLDFYGCLFRLSGVTLCTVITGVQQLPLMEPEERNPFKSQRRVAHRLSEATSLGTTAVEFQIKGNIKHRYKDKRAMHLGPTRTMSSNANFRCALVSDPCIGKSFVSQDLCRIS